MPPMLPGRSSGSGDRGGNPYRVVGDLTVPGGRALVIQPGCRIEFQGHYQFRIDSLAALQAVGTETDSILFSAINTDVGWNGLRFNWADSTSRIAYCRFEWGRGAMSGQYPDETRTAGGAVYLKGGTLSIRNSLFRFNWAFEGLGGAIYADSASLGVRDCVLEHNRAGFGGAAIYATYSTVLIEGNTISKDTTWYPLGGEHGGGAVGCWYSNVEIRNNIITENLCGQRGGGVLISESTANITNNVISNNEAWYYGGGSISAVRPDWWGI